MKNVPLQAVSLVGLVNAGVGLTVIVKVCLMPMHPGVPFVITGVTVIIPLIGCRPVLLAVKEGILPVPVEASPIVVLLLVQLYKVALPLKLTGLVSLLLQMAWSEVTFTVGAGLMVTAMFTGVPEHPFSAAVAWNPIVCCVFKELENDPLISPVPLKPERPSLPTMPARLSLVQVMVAPPTLLVKPIGLIVAPLQIV